MTEEKSETAISRVDFEFKTGQCFSATVRVRKIDNLQHDKLHLTPKALFGKTVSGDTIYKAMSYSTSPSNSSADYRLYLYAQLATGISLAVLSPITIISNVLLLLTILKDPLKCFRSPATYLIVALALVDLMTGLLIEPCFIIYRVASYIRWSHSPGEPYERVLQIGTWLSTVGLDMSFLLVLGLILSSSSL